MSPHHAAAGTPAATTAQPISTKEGRPTKQILLYRTPVCRVVSCNRYQAQVFPRTVRIAPCLSARGYCLGTVIAVVFDGVGQGACRVQQRGRRGVVLRRRRWLLRGVGILGGCGLP